MALIECPSCGNQISDKAVQCPVCGYRKTEQDTPVEEFICEECGAVLNENDIACPTCGYPIEKIKKEDSPQKVEVTSIKIPKLDRKKKTVITIASVLVIVLIGVIISGVAISKKNNKAKYKENLSNASSTMLLGAATAENVGGLIHDVWYNTIYEKDDTTTDKYTKHHTSYFYDDFNDSLHNLMVDDDFQKKIDAIKSNQDTVNSIMKDLVNPPDEYKEAYDKLQDLYDSYLELTNLAVDPTGNLTSYTSSFNSADTAVSNAYKAMQRYLD